MMFQRMLTFLKNLVPKGIQGYMNAVLIGLAIIASIIIGSVIYQLSYQLNESEDLNLKQAHLLSQSNYINKVLTNENEQLLSDLKNQNDVLDDLLSQLEKERELAAEREQSLLVINDELHGKLQKLEIEVDKETDIAECLSIPLTDELMRLLNE